MSARAAQLARVLLGAVLPCCAPPEVESPAPVARAAGEREANLRIVWVDVDGGAATLIVTPEGESLLADAGWPGARDAERIAAAARAEGLERIDHLLVTHFHTDHWGGVAELARRLPIARVYDRGLPPADAQGIDPRIKPELRAAYLATTGGRSTVLRAGDVLPLVGARVEIVCANGLVRGEPAGSAQTRACDAHAARPDDETDNALSLGYLLTLGEVEFLDLGDLSWNVEHKLVCPDVSGSDEPPASPLGPIDVYQASHHGHHESNNPVLLAALRPTVAVVGNGPRKGLSAPVYAALRATPELSDVFQLHRNLLTGASDNAAPEFIANDAEDCRGEPIRLELDPAGKSYTLEVRAKKTVRTYAVKPR